MRWVALVCLLGGCDIVLGLDKPPLDAVVVADAFEPAACPTQGYKQVSTLRSRYRFVMIEDTFANQASRCILDSEGLTHLAVLESEQEAFAVDQELDNIGADMSFWIGLKQAPTALLPTDGWTWITGAALAPTAWRMYEPDDNDVPPIVEDHEEDRGMMDRVGTGTKFAIDAPEGAALFAICECDGIDLR